MFRKYHYLNYDMNKSAKCFVALYNNNPVAFSAWIHFPHPKVKNYQKETRTVVFPDYQGVGIATAIRNYIAEYYKNIGKICITTLSHPALINSMNKDKKWICMRKGRTSSSRTMLKSFKKTNSGKNRITTSWKYIG